jgi:hypothetical protein
MAAAVDTRIAEEHSLAAQVAALRLSLAKFEDSGFELAPAGVTVVCSLLLGIEEQAERLEAALRRRSLQ